MFILAKKYSFGQDVKACSLSAHCNYSEDFSWELNLASQSALTRLQHKSAHASFRISASPPLGQVHWQDLAGSGFEILDEATRKCFQFHFDMGAEWEDLIDLHLRFGQARGTQIEVFAEGHGCVEAWPDFFPEGVAHFQIEAWVPFRGVGINIPLNATEPAAYSTAKIRAMFPQYKFHPPIIRKSGIAGGSPQAIEALFSPDESAS